MHLVTWPHTCEYYHLNLNTVMNSFLNKAVTLWCSETQFENPKLFQICSLSLFLSDPVCMLAPAFLVRNVVLSLCTVGYSVQRKWKSLESGDIRPKPKSCFNRHGCWKIRPTHGQFVFDYTRVNMVAEVDFILLLGDCLYKLSVVDSCLNGVESTLLIVVTIVFGNMGH